MKLMFLRFYLDATPNLMPFCLQDKQAGTTFNIVPFEFPVINSKYAYKLAAKHYFGFHCDGKPYDLNYSRSEFRFRGPPPMRSYCFVQLYIEPIACIKWTHNLLLPAGRKEVFWMVPVSYLDPLYGYRMRSQNTDTVFTVKSGTFFICLEYARPNGAQDAKKKIYGLRFWGVVSYLWSHPVWLKLQNSVRPSILSLRWDGYSSRVKETQKITCIGYQFWTSAMLGFPNRKAEWLQENQQRFYYTHSQKGRFLFIFYYSTFATSKDVQNQSSEVSNWIGLEQTAGKCGNDKFYTTPFMITTVWLRWKPLLKHSKFLFSW